LSEVFLKSGREKALRRRHPWVFSGAISRVSGEPARGATVDVRGAGGEWLARAAYSPDSQIRLRIWSFDEAVPIDERFIRARLARAIELRRRLGLLADETGCRLVFSESDGLPGLIVDRYADYLVCQFSAAGAEHWREAIADQLMELVRPAGIYERSEGSARRKEGLPARRGLLRGREPAEPVRIRAGKTLQLVDLAHGQKTGAYLDQRENRERVARYADGAQMLDAFAYSGGFAIAALCAGAAGALLLDSSGEALGVAQREAALNGVEGRCRFATANVFEELRALRDRGERFGLVVLDPPKFVHTAEQVQAGSRAYKDVNMLGLQLVEPGGVLATFSCSGHVDAPLFQKIVAGAAVDARRDAQIIERLTQPADHPVALEFPEAEYLKGLILRVL
jgi:23S rRNA (cytosine1962-C5)-methyltransferase